MLKFSSYMTKRCPDERTREGTKAVQKERPMIVKAWRRRQERELGDLGDG